MTTYVPIILSDPSIPTAGLETFFAECGHVAVRLEEHSFDRSHFNPLRANVPIIAVQHFASGSIRLCQSIKQQYPYARVLAFPDKLIQLERLRGTLSLWDGPHPTPLCEAAMRKSYQCLGDEDLTIDKLCKLLACSHDKLEREFALSGYPPAWKWIMRKRIEEAKRLLDTTSLRVSEVALAVGYFDLSSFSRTFHKSAGMSPSNWRRVRSHFRSGETSSQA
jgi:AraC-like DNA-binding protein